jgi:hypothetical protein
LCSITEWKLAVSIYLSSPPIKTIDQSGTIHVPVSPRNARPIFSGLVTIACLPPISRNQTIAWILGAIEPFAKCVPSARYFLASERVIRSSHFWSGFPKFNPTFYTAVEIKNRSAPINCANRLLAKSLSITAAIPRSVRSPISMTGIPPPPTVITTTPAPIKVFTA